MKCSIRRQSAILTLLAAASCLCFAAEPSFDIARSTLRIHVGKAGLFSAAGHEHWVSAPIAAGGLQESEPAQVWFRVDAGKLTVEPDEKLSPADQAQVQQTMQTKVLDSAHYPEISFRSTSVASSSDGTWLVKGDLTLHGQAHSVSTTVRKQADAYVGSCQIKQTDFGIQPVRVGGGMVKVKDELEVEFSIVLGPAPTGRQ
jgi:polyisoprenoid-binding protein YceI